MKRCTRCNSLVKDDALFCPECGENIFNISPFLKKTDKKSKLTKIFIILSLVFFIAYYLLLSIAEFDYASSFVGIICIFAIISCVIAIVLTKSKTNKYLSLSILFFVIFVFEFFGAIFSEQSIGSIIFAIIVSLAILATAILFCTKYKENLISKIFFIITASTYFIISIFATVGAFSLSNEFYYDGYLYNQLNNMNSYNKYYMYANMYELVGVARCFMIAATSFLVPVAIFRFVNIKSTHRVMRTVNNSVSVTKKQNCNFYEAQDKLQKLKELYDNEIITEKEYEEKRKKYLDNL